MYVPTNIAASTATYAPVTPTANSALFQAQDMSGARQTQLAVTGPGAALIPNTVTSRPQAYAIQPRPAYIAAQFLAQELSAQEAQAFFTPTAQPVTQSSAQPIQLQSAPSGSGTTPSAASANPSLVAPLTSSVVTRTPAPAEPIRRNLGVAAYSSANALLASSPEIDTSL